MTDAPYALALLVRFVHVLAGILWVGGMVYAGFVMGRTLKSAPPQIGGGAMMRIAPVSYRFLSWAGAVTIVFGVWNQWILSHMLDYRTGTWNVLMGATLIVSIIMMGIAGAVMGPAIKRLVASAPPAGAAASATGPGGPPPPEMLAARDRLMKAGMINIALGLVAVFLMVWSVKERTG